MNAAIFILILMWAMHLLPFLFPDWRMWGFDHLRFLPGEAIWAYVIAGTAGIAGMSTPQVRRRILQFYDRIADSLFAEANFTRWIILSIVALIVFWWVRLPINLLGDARTVMANIGDQHPVFYKWSQMGAIAVAHGLSKLLPQSGLELGRVTYQIVSVVSGAVTVYFLLAIAREISADTRVRLLTLALFFFSGWTLLFFGYVENYPILWPFVAAFIYSTMRCLKHSRFPLAPGLIIIAAMTVHVQIVCFLPSLAFLIYEYYARRFKRPGTATAAVLTALSVVLTAVVIMLAYQRSLDIRLLLIRIGTGHPQTPDYTLFSLTHLCDIANELLLLIPVLPALLVVAIRKPKREFESFDWFLLFFSIGGLIFLFGIEPGLGMARDWDLFALSGLGPLLLLIRMIRPPDKSEAYILPMLALFSAIMILPFWITAMRTPSAIQHYSHLLNLDLPRSRTGITILRDIYSERGDTAAVDSLDRVLADTYPAHTMAPRANRLIASGQYRQALAIADSLYARNPYSIEALNLRGKAHLYLGEFEPALDNLERAADLGRYDSRILVNLAQAHFMVGNIDEVMGNLRRAQTLNPESFYVIEAFATVFFRWRLYDSAYVYATEMIEADSSFPAGYSLAGMAALNRGDTAEAKSLLSRFLTLSPRDPNRAYIDSIFQSLP